MALSNKRPIAVLHMRALRRIGNFILKMRSIALDMTNNPAYFPSPMPSLAVFTAHITGLEAAEDEARTRLTGKAAERNLKYEIVLDDVHSLLNYVQTVADVAANEEEAITIINASGFSLKIHGVHVKPDLAANNTKVSGTVKLIAKSHGNRSANEWEMSDDMINWTHLPGTVYAKTMVSGLMPGSTKYFRHRPILRGKTQSAWSQIVSIIVT
jgi:hypothetical protein